MGKSPSNDKGEKSFISEKPEVAEKKQPVDWVCMTECHCSDNGNPIRAKRWLPGESVFGTHRPSKHFVTREEYNTGAGGREEYLAKFQKFGGIVNDQARNLPLHVLKAYVMEQERKYLRQQSQAY